MNNDNDLMQLVKQKDDKEAFEKLIKKYRQYAINYANKIIKDMYVAEDMAQESFVTIYLKGNKYKQNKCFKSYLLVIVKNNCIDCLRKNNVEISLADSDYINMLQHNDNPLNILIKEEDKDYIKEILNVLSDNERKILYMYAVCGMSYKYISYTLNKSLSGIKITIYRARKKLKKYNINLNEVTL